MLTWEKVKNAIEWMQLAVFVRDLFAAVLSLKGGKEAVDICSSLIRRLGNYHRVACCHIRFVWSYLVAATYEDIGTKSNHTKCDERTDDVANNV